jgi:hypothetical protein
MRIAFGKWTPDRPGIAGGLTEALNCLPVASGYSPMPSNADLSTSASESLLTSFIGRLATTTTLFAAGPTKLFKFDPADSGLDDVSRASPAYTTTDLWTTAQFGAVVLAANGQNIIQAWDMGSSVAFADVDASAPTAQFVTVVRDQVVAAKTASNIATVYWSDLNDETNWTPGAGSQADSQVIPDGGEIRGLTGGEFGIVLLERAIARMTYIGSPFFYQFDIISRNLGCYESRSVVQVGPLTYFLSDDGFFVTNGQEVKPIGNEVVDRWFFQNAAPDKLNLMSAASDPVNKMVVWCFRDIFNVQKVLVYNYAVDKWSHGETTADFVSTLATASYTLEQLANISTNLDALPESLDSRLWAGGRLVLGGVDGAKLVTFGGPELTAVLTTGDIEQEATETILTLARPIVDNGSATVSASSRYRLDGNINYSTPVAADSENRVPLRSRGKYHRVSLTPTGNWNTAVGVDVEMKAVGGR